MAEFRILGTVEAYGPDGQVDAGPPRQRTVLAALLVDAGQVVPVSTLVDRVWGDAPPESARRSLHSHIARLRRLVDGLSTVREPVGLVRQADGYQLRVPPEQVDALRFRALVERARDQPDDEQADLLRAALDLWRGEPLAGTSGDWAARQRERLAQQRVDAAVGWARAELRRGNAATLTGPLGELVAAHPLAEPLAASYLLALHATGRSADGLRHYETVRRALAGTLGVDPSEELREVHRTLLRGDERGRPVPAMLPPDLPAFTGRGAQLARLDRIADQPGAVAIAALTGPPGVGKTALAVHWAHQARHRYPDGQLYLNLRGFDPTGADTGAGTGADAGEAVEPAQAVRTLLDALGVPAERIPTDPDAQVGLYRSELTGRRVLVLLDNARDAAQVRPLLPGSPATAVLVTSRNQLAGLVAAEGARPLALPLLDPAESADLLAARLGPRRVATDPAAVRAIAGHCAGLPLALAVAAARAATAPDRPLAALAAELASAAALDALAGDDPTTDVRAVFGCSYRALSPPAARLFRLLGTSPAPDLPVPAAASLAGLPAPRVRPLLAELAAASLVAEHSQGRYAMHDLLRAYAAELATAELATADAAALQRLLDHYLHTAEHAARLLNPSRDPAALPPPGQDVTLDPPATAAAALDWFGTERQALVAAVRHAGRTGSGAAAGQLASAMFTFLDGQGRWLDIIATQQAAIDAGDRAVQVRAHRLLGLTHLRLARYPAAHDHLRQASALAAQLGDHLSQARCADVLSTVYNRQGDQAAALAYAREAGELYRRADHPAGQASALNAIGWIHAQLGEHERALSCCEQALEIQQRIGDRPGAADTWDSIGYARHLLGRHAGAIAAYRRALALYAEVGDRNLAAETLVRLGDAAQAAGDLDTAADSWQRAAGILDELDRPDLRARLAQLTER